MRIYLSSNFANVNKVKQYMNELIQGGGHEITYDWTLKNPNLSREVDGINSINTAQILIALIDHEYNTQNDITFIEIGCAIGQNKLVLLYNKQPQNTVYHHRIQSFNSLSSLSNFLRNFSIDFS